MRYRRSYSQDPYWTKARFTSTCCKCGKSISKGSDIFYYPKGKSVYCKSPCGESASNDFASHAADEAVYNGYGNPFAD